MIEKVQMHKELCDALHEIYKQKNAAYGDSFGRTYHDLGLISCLTRISDKYNRLINLGTHRDVDQGDEAITDTLMDLSNYCLMTIMEIERDRHD